MTVKVFIHDPHHKLVRKNTQFWNASGFESMIPIEDTVESGIRQLNAN